MTHSKALKNLKYNRTYQVYKCNACDSIQDFVIIKNGDIECSYCGDKKGNLATVSQLYEVTQWAVVEISNVLQRRPEAHEEWHDLVNDLSAIRARLDLALPSDK